MPVEATDSPSSSQSSAHAFHSFLHAVSCSCRAKTAQQTQWRQMTTSRLHRSRRQASLSLPVSGL